MRVETTPIPGLFLVELAPHGDERGTLTRTYCRATFEELGLEAHIEQINMVWNHGAGILRGLHFQHRPHAETKVVHCAVGTIFDVVVDLRDDELSVFSVELAAERPRLLIVPEGCAHGYQSTSDVSCVHYLMSRAYAPEAEGALRWDDPVLSIDWPIRPPTLSARDSGHPYLRQ